MEVALPYLYLLVIILSTWSVTGFARGVVPEIVNFAGILFSWLFVVRLGDVFVDLVNKLTRTVLFLIRGGIEAENPSALVRSLNSVRLVDPAQPQVALAVLFLVIVAAFFLLSGRFVPPRRSVLTKVLGSVFGALNGYLAAFVIFRAPSPKAELVFTIGLPTARSAEPFGPYLSALVIAAVGLAIIIGLMMSLRASRQNGGTRFAEKRRG